MRTIKPFVVIQNGKPIFAVYAYSAEQARAHVAAKVAGAVIVVAVTKERTVPLCSPAIKLGAVPDDPRHQERPSRDGMCLSDAKEHTSRA